MNNSHYNGKDKISVKGIQPYLTQSLQNGILKRIFVYDILESTNITAKEATLDNAEFGTVIIADSQTAGKGRYGKSFFSPPNHGLYMSAVLNSALLPFDTQSLITVFAAVSVCQAIETISGKSPQIKWVNDIFLNKKKICGILTESVTTPQNTASRQIIIGIGINFSTPATGFPAELQQIAGSLFETENTTVTRNCLAAGIINNLFTLGNRYSKNEILTEYKQRVFILGKEILITGNDKPYRATAVDIDDNGYLIVRKSDGELLTLFSGEIRQGASVAVSF